MDDTQRDSLLEICGKGRDIVTVECADRLLGPFGFTANDLGLVYEAKAGIDFGAGVERWKGGPQVDVCGLAMVLADKLGAPDVKYDTDYSGIGKRSAALTTKAVLRLRKLAGEVIPTCDDCGTADLYDGSLCFVCGRNRDDTASYAVVSKETFPTGHTWNGVDVSDRTYYEVRKGSDHIHTEYDGDDMLARFYFVDGELALRAAYEADAACGLVGPIQVVTGR